MNASRADLPLDHFVRDQKEALYAGFVHIRQRQSSHFQQLVAQPENIPFLEVSTIEKVCVQLNKRAGHPHLPE